MWSIWPDPEQIKVNGEAAAGPAPAPAGRELHKRMWLGMVLGRSRAKHVRGCAGRGTASVGGGKEALLKIPGDLGQALFWGQPLLLFLPLLPLPADLGAPGTPCVEEPAAGP